MRRKYHINHISVQYVVTCTCVIFYGMIVDGYMWHITIIEFWGKVWETRVYVILLRFKLRVECCKLSPMIYTAFNYHLGICRRILLHEGSSTYFSIRNIESKAYLKSYQTHFFETLRWSMWQIYKSQICFWDHLKGDP